MKAFWYKSKNFGDQLTPDILKFFLNEEIELADREDKGKLMGIGSIMTALRNNDVVWGSGSIRNMPLPQVKGVKILSLRGPLTRNCLRSRNKHLDIPEIYGDPAILLPLVYYPKIEKTHELGLLPHYVDKKAVINELEIMNDDQAKFIDIEDDWKKVVDEILSCELIVTSSLHGIIAAEAYGMPVVWTKYSNKIIGGDFKFQDYFLGTGRKEQSKDVNIDPLENLKERQNILIKILKQQYGKN